MPLVQPYIGLAHRYMFFEKWLVDQLLAAKRQAVVVFPVQPYGNWGPFGEVAGRDPDHRFYGPDGLELSEQ